MDKIDIERMRQIVGELSSENAWRLSTIEQAIKYLLKAEIERQEKPAPDEGGGKA